MKNLKLIFAGLCWAYLTAGVSACEMDMQEREELRALCMPITAGCPDSEYPIAQDVLEKVLLKPFMEKVLLVRKEERQPLVSLVTPWFDMDTVDIHELLLRKSLILMTDKLTQVPLTDRGNIMQVLSRIIDLITPGLDSCQNSPFIETSFCVDRPTHAARHIFLAEISSIAAHHLKSVLNLVLPNIEHAPKDGSSINFFTAVQIAKKTLVFQSSFL